jgi:3-deoxy-D-manno-octulosonic-acid transferase
MSILYNIGIYLLTGLAYLLSPFNRRIKLWREGNRNWFENLRNKISAGERYVWVHCASLGEFEQGRPVIEAIKKEKPHVKIILTFFSPSGYEVRKNYKMADIICYLPPDTPVNAGRFIKMVDPAVVIFVKYEFWYNYLSLLGERKTPLYLISGIFSGDQHFFRWYGSFFRRILKNFTWFFVQDQSSLELLGKIGFQNATVAGDTRFDRVVEIAGAARAIQQIEHFRGSEKLFLAGSSWKQDEEIIAGYINSNPGRMKWIFAPHEIDPGNIERLTRLLRVRYVKFSEYSDNESDARVMIIDNIGMLSSAYQYAAIAAVGGGFGRGIHNILEPSCWGIPVLFGPVHRRFREAVEMLERGGAFSYCDPGSFKEILETLLNDEETYSRSAETAKKYVAENTGATHKIMQGIT